MAPLDKKTKPRHRARGDPDEDDEEQARAGKKVARAASASGSDEEEDASDEEEGSSAPEVSTSEDDNSQATSSSDDSEDEDEDDDGQKKNKKQQKPKELNVDFQFFEPAERDFHGLRALLSSYLDGKGYDVGSLADAVIAQGAKGDGVGTVVRALDATPSAAGGKKQEAAAGPSGSKAAEGEDDADPIAVVTAVGLEGYRTTAPFVAGVRDFLLARAEAAGKRAAFEAAWDAPRAALLLNERLVNCPPQIAPPLIQYLFEEIERARVEEAEERAELEAAAAAAGSSDVPPPSAAAACGYAFDRYILLTRVYEDPQGQGDDEDDEDSDEEEDGRKKKKAKKAKKKQSKGGSGDKQAGNKAKAAAAGGGGQPVLVYTRPEDRFFHARSTASFTFPVEGRPVARGELRPLRLALVLPASEVAAARRELDSAVGNARAMPPPPPRR